MARPCLEGPGSERVLSGCRPACVRTLCPATGPQEGPEGAGAALGWKRGAFSREAPERTEDGRLRSRGLPCPPSSLSLSGPRSESGNLVWKNHAATRPGLGNPPPPDTGSDISLGPNSPAPLGRRPQCGCPLLVLTAPDPAPRSLGARRTGASRALTLGSQEGGEETRALTAFFARNKRFRS